MKFGKKIIVFLVCLAFLAQIMLIGTKSSAYSIGETCYLERADKGYYTIQFWNGSEWIYVTYCIINYVDEQGNKQVAYCVNPDRKGIGYISGEFSGYDVQLKNLIDNEKCWRVLKNGYPYKSAEELGVETEQDAYLATKMAVYAMLRDKTESDIRALYRAGKDRVAGQNLADMQRRGNKVIEAICNLVNIGNGSSEKMNFNNSFSIEVIGNFEADKNDEQFYCQNLKVKCDVDISEFSIDSITGFPVGTIITDSDGNKKNTFKGGDEFIIKVPKKSLIEDIAGKIELVGRCENYPMYYAECNDGVHQNYFLCCDRYSNPLECKSNINISISKSKLKIIKKDKDTSEPIANVKFSVKYKDGTDIGTYATDSNGVICIDNLHQGIVVVKEINCPDNYELLNDEMCVEIEYSDSKEIIIENELKEVPEAEQPKEVEQEEIQKLPRTGLVDFNIVMFEIAAICLVAKIIV